MISATHKAKRHCTVIFGGCVSKNFLTLFRDETLIRLVPDVHENRADFVLKKIHIIYRVVFDDAIKRSNREKERDDDPMTRSFFLLQILLSFFIRRTSVY